MCILKCSIMEHPTNTINLTINESLSTFHKQTNDFRGSNLPLTQAFLSLKEQQQDFVTDNQVRFWEDYFCWQDEEEKSSYINMRKWLLKEVFSLPFKSNQYQHNNCKTATWSNKRLFYKIVSLLCFYAAPFSFARDKYGLIPIHHRKNCILSSQKASIHWFWCGALSSLISDDVKKPILDNFLHFQHPPLPIAIFRRISRYFIIDSCHVSLDEIEVEMWW